MICCIASGTMSFLFLILFRQIVFAQFCVVFTAHEEASVVSVAASVDSNGRTLL